MQCGGVSNICCGLLCALIVIQSLEMYVTLLAVTQVWRG